MSAPFRNLGSGIALDLTEMERRVLMLVPAVLDGVGAVGEDPAADRLDYRPHPDDPEAAEQYQDLIGDDLEVLRLEDRRAFSESIASPRLALDQAEAWLRVVGEARLVLAARVGITEDGWEANPVEDPEMALLHMLGHLQDELIGALND